METQSLSASAPLAALEPQSPDRIVEELLPIVRVFPAYEYTPTERVEDVLAIYRDTIVFFRKDQAVEIPSEAGEPDGLEALLAVKSRGRKKRCSLQQVEKAEMSKFATRGGRLYSNVSWIRGAAFPKGRELRFSFSDAKPVAFFLPDMESERIRLVLPALLGDRLRENVEFGRAKLRPRWSVLGVPLGLVVWGFLVYVVSAADWIDPSSGPLAFIGLAALPATVVLFVRLVGWYQARSVSRIRNYHPSLPEDKKRESRPRRIGLPWLSRPLSWLCKLSGIVLLLAALGIGSYINTSQLKGDSSNISQLVFGWGVVPGVALIYLGYRLGLRPGKRGFRKGDRAPVVYLRSFGDDGKKDFNPSGFLPQLMGLQAAGALSALGPFANAHPVRLLRLLWSRSADTAEEQLAGFFRRMGPFVAIGRPGDRLAHGGAERVYLTEGNWQEHVQQLLAQAQLVVLQPAESEGVWWELLEAQKTTSPGKILICLINYRRSAHQYEQFCERLRQATRVRLPRYLGPNLFLCFDTCWNGRLLPLRLASPLVWPLKGCAVNFSKTFRPWMESGDGRVVPISPPPRRFSWAVQSLFGIGFWFAFVAFTLALAGVCVLHAVQEAKDRALIRRTSANSEAGNRSLSEDYSLHLAANWSPDQRIKQSQAQVYRLGETAALTVVVEPAVPIGGRRTSTEELSQLYLDQIEKNVRTPLRVESRKWMERDGQQWLETVFVAPTPDAYWVVLFPDSLKWNLGQVQLRYIQRVLASSEKYCKVIAFAKRHQFGACEPVLRSALDGFHLASPPPGAARSQAVYPGKILPYSLRLSRDWRPILPQGDFDSLFELGESSAFGVIAEKLADLPEGFTPDRYGDIVLQTARRGSESVEVLFREPRDIAGQTWLVLRYRWRSQGLNLTTSVAVRFASGWAYQLNGWTTDPATGNAEIEKAMEGFVFPKPNE